MATYEELIAKARELHAAGDIESAKRVAQIAVNRRKAAEAQPGAPSNADPESAGMGGSPAEYEGQDAALTLDQQKALALGRARRRRAEQNGSVGGAPQQDIGTGSGVAANLTQGLLFGLGDEYMAGLGALAGFNKSDDGTESWFDYSNPIGDRYKMGLDAARADMERFSSENPKTAMAAELTGAIASPLSKVAAPFKAAAGAGRVKQLATAAGNGAVGAGAYGFNSGEGGFDARLRNAENAATIGALLGPGFQIAGNTAQGLANKARDSRAMKEFVAAAPSTDDLFSKAKSMYGDAVAKGSTAGGNATADFAASIRKIADDEGLILPSGKFVGGFPKVAAALRMVDEYAGQAMTPEQVGKLRKSIKTARKSTDPEEARLGVILARKFDDFAESVMPGTKQANAVYAQAKKAEKIDNAITASKAAGATLKGEFSKLDRRAAAGKMKNFGPEEQAAISRTANGGKAESVARTVSGLRPSALSMGSIGGGSTLASLALGNPAFMAMGLGTLGAGQAAKMTADGMTRKNADIVRALVRSGGKMPTPESNPIMQRILEALQGGSRRSVPAIASQF